MNPPPVSSAYHSPPRSTSHPPLHPSQPNHSRNAYEKPFAHDTRHYEQQQPSYSYPPIPRASHLHLPGVNTYIEHYHYYNFNGNCTVQQASGSGQPNTIRMAPSTMRQPQPASQHIVEVPPVPPPVSTPLQFQSDPYPPYHHHNSDRYARESHPQHSSRLHPHLAPLSTSRPTSAGGQLPPHSSFLATTRLAKPPPTLPEARQMHPESSLLTRIRPTKPEAPILAPLHSSVPSSLSPLHADDKVSARPIKRSRLSRSGVTIPFASQPIGALPHTAAPGGGSESNCASVAADDRVATAIRGSTFAMTDRPTNAANSSSPSQSEYPLPIPRSEGFERSSGSAGNVRVTRNTEESQSNDWEAVVEMYTTGKGTEDGVALKMITKGDGRRVSDRKLLEKRRTIGKTYECLGPDRFERAIGYKWENGVRRKQKMYHVISRCRVVNAMRKSGEPIPEDCEELTLLIDERIAEKEALKAGVARRGQVGSGGRHGTGQGRRGHGSSMSYSLEDSGRLKGSRVNGHEDGGSGTGADLGGLAENEEQSNSRRRSGHEHRQAVNGGSEATLRARDEEEIRPGRVHKGGRYDGEACS